MRRFCKDRPVMSLDRRSLRTRKITRSNSGNSCRASRRFNLREAERFQKGGRLCRNLFFSPYPVRRGKNAEEFLKYKIRRSSVCII